MRKLFFFPAALLVLALIAGSTAGAQQYKIRQVNNMMGMKAESTVYVKAMRKRTESAPVMGMSIPVTIEQCDKQRIIKINDKKKLYYIEPFAKETDEVIDDDVKTPVKAKPMPSQVTDTKSGGVITMWYTITDTGERKNMNGFTARHVWTYQKMKPSPDACSMKDSFIIKTDGWYIDLPQFNCPVRYRPARPATAPERPQPECVDRFVTHRSGKGKLGFPLTEKRTMIMGGGGAKTSEFETNIETLELTTEKLDSMLFEIPLGYTETKNEADLQDKFDMNEMIKQQKAGNVPDVNSMSMGNDKVAGYEKAAGEVLVGVYEPKNDGQLQGPLLQQYLVNTITGGNIKAVAVSSEEHARTYNCDYTLATDFIKIKSGSKVGGLIKAIKNTDPNASSSYTIQASQTLVKLADGSVRAQPKIDGKYDGKIDDAAKKALDDGTPQVLKALK